MFWMRTKENSFPIRTLIRSPALNIFKKFPFMYVLVTYKNKENQMKNEGARVVPTLYSFILDAQEQHSWWMGMAEN